MAERCYAAVKWHKRKRVDPRHKPVRCCRPAAVMHPTKKKGLCVVHAPLSEVVEHSTACNERNKKVSDAE